MFGFLDVSKQLPISMLSWTRADLAEVTCMHPTNQATFASCNIGSRLKCTLSNKKLQWSAPPPSPRVPAPQGGRTPGLPRCLALTIQWRDNVRFASFFQLPHLFHTAKPILTLGHNPCPVRPWWPTDHECVQSGALFPCHLSVCSHAF